MKQKIELLAPAGNFEKLEIAVHYGADAVYLAGKDFSLRNFSDNFSINELENAVKFTKEHGVKLYIACNIYSRNNEQNDIASFLEKIGLINPDAIIISDPGILLMAKKIIPHINIHLSTQANTTNYNTVKFWETFGIKRINTARELSISEITEIAQKCNMEIETFIHGAMCISYSGRCLLSSFLLERDGNRGLCAHPCRWKYSVVEEQRPGEYMPLLEDKRGSYIFHSKDLCTIEHIPALINAGINSFKIEGRMKGINYLATTVKIYREAIDSYFADSENYTVKPEWIEEISHINHRNYCTGFYFNNPNKIISDNPPSDQTPTNQTTPNYSSPNPGTLHQFIGKITENISKGTAKVEVRNKIKIDDNIEVLEKKGPATLEKIISMTDLNGNPCTEANPNSTVIIKTKGNYQTNDLLRKR